MAKRSDFAQKLLDDLRLRKERLAASESSSQTKPTVADAYAHAKKNYRGSREFKTNDTKGYRTGTTQDRSRGGTKYSFITGDASKQIVTVGKAQSTERVGNFSMALAFALENGGNLGIIDSSGDSVLAFLNQLSGRALNYQKMGSRNSIDRHRPSSSRLPTFSHIHLKEISRGAQKLNQILTTCSNGLNFDRYSIEIGNELLKGAIDLEESLRMLINLQDASENMISPQRKSRITLLDEDEDENDNTINLAEQKQLALPRFSFDKSPGNYHDIQEVAKNDLWLRLAALSYPSDARKFIYEKKSASHKQSVKSSSNVKTLNSFSEQKNHSSSSQPKPEKARIPNVIAKLMGLDELPGNVDSKDTSQRGSGSKQKVEEKILKKTVLGSTKMSKKRTEDDDNLASPLLKQKMIRTNDVSAVQNSVSMPAEIDIADRNASFQVFTHDAKPPRKDLESTNPVTGFEKASIKVEKQQSNITPLNHNIGSHKHIEEKHRERQGAEKIKMKEPVLKDELQRVAPLRHKKSEVTVMSQEKSGFKEGMIRTENFYTKKLLPGSRQKSQTNHGFQQPHMPQKREPLEEKQHAEEKEQQSAKQKLPKRKQMGSEPLSVNDEINLQKKHLDITQVAASKKTYTEAVDSTQSERFPNGRRHEDFASTGGSNSSSNISIKASPSRNPNQDTSIRDLESKLLKPKAAIPPVTERKHVHEQATWKAESIKVNKRETPRMINEVMVRRGGALLNAARTQKQRNSRLKEVKQRRKDKLISPREEKQMRASKSKEKELSIIKSKKPVPSIQPSYVVQHMQKEDLSKEAPVLYSPDEQESQIAKKTLTLAPNDNSQHIIPMAMSDQQSEEPLFDGAQKLKSRIIESSPVNGTLHGSSNDIAYPSELECRKFSKPQTPEPLTASENHLKQILIKSQIFLNTAEALFKLNIPFNILHEEGHDCQDDESRLILDCAFEIMKRKGRRQELSVHLFVRVSITAMKARTSDDLVKQLDKDIEKLKFYCGNGNGEVAVEDYVPKMLESEVYGNDPDVNCMWDLSWNEMMFAFIEKDDVIRDVERFIINGLVDEITRDLLHIQVQAI